MTAAKAPIINDIITYRGENGLITRRVITPSEFAFPLSSANLAINFTVPSLKPPFVHIMYILV